ncbi:MAG TPA: translation initiation factor IF-2 [Moorella mulderi]|nr:translation initiation factor IF-2 [Moorella mulderi]
MGKTRVYELAKQLQVSTKELMETMSQLGIYTRSHMSVLENGEVIKIRNYYRQLWRQKQAQPQEVPKGEEPKKEMVPQKDREEPEVKVEAVQPKPAEEKKPEEKARIPADTPKEAPAPSARGPKGAEAPARGAKRPAPERKGPPFPKPSRETVAKEKEARPKELRIPKPEVVGKEVQEKKRERPGERMVLKKEKEVFLETRRKVMEEEELLEKRLLRRPREKAAPKEEAVPEAPAPKRITLTGSLTVQELAKKLGKSAAEVIKTLLKLGVVATINQELDVDTATLVAQELGAEVEIREEKPLAVLEDLPDDPATLKPKPPVVTVMGHVDHGKTSLLDAIRHTNVAAKESGGITQHIGAYQVEIGGRKITFLDTPGHEAFTAMRARGAQVTDIAVLVVAADDGVMPQTIEAINHARAAQVPIVVAINKIDKPDANPDRVKQQLAEHGLIPEEWGGDTIMVPVSALKKQGINELLEMILLTADIMELKANPDRPARGVVLEAQLDKGKGPTATLLVQKGTLKVGDDLVVGEVYGKVRAMMNERGERLKSAGPSTPVLVMGLNDVPQAGNIFQVVEDEKIAREIALARQEQRRQEELKTTRTSLADIFQQMEKEVKELNLIIKADVWGSVEALKQALERLSTEEVKVNIIHAGVGAITETDVMLAQASKAIIIGFHVRPDSNARKAAEESGTEIRLYRVIYEVLEDIKAAMAGLLEPEKREVVLGRAEVRATFKVPKVGTVAGCFVLEGKVQNKALARVIRDGAVVYEGRIASLKRFKDDVREVSQGYECGIGLEKFNDVKEGDIIEAYTIEEIQRELA